MFKKKRIKQIEEGMEMIPKKKYVWKEKEPKRVSTKKYSVKKFRMVFLGILICLTFSGLYATIRSFVVNGKVNALMHQTEKLEKGTSEKKEVGVQETAYRVEFYLNPFVESYLTQSEDFEAIKKRKEELSSYYAEGVTEKSNEGMSKRTVEDYELIDIQEKENYVTVSYKVAYRVNNGSVMKRVLNVDIAEQKGKFSVVSLPYFVDIPSLKTKSRGLQKKEEGTMLSSTEDQELQKFIETYLKKYAEGTKEDLSYLSKNTENLNGQYTLDSIVSSEIYAQENKHYTAYVEASFKEKQTGSLHTEYFSIDIMKEQEKYKVNQLHHNLGGF